MADYCSACGALKEYAPNFVVNGITDKECNSLQNNTGLNPDLEVLHNNCQDLNDLLDCLIGALHDKLPAYDVCDWKEYMDELMSNIYNIKKAIICSECGLWTALEQSSYLGVATLLTTTGNSMCGDQTKQLEPAFNDFVEQSNLPDNVLTRTSDFKGIIVNNTTAVPLLVNSTFNCSIETDKLLSSTYIVVTRDGNKIGQTPFVTATTYDQQVAAEPFILQPGQKSTLRYYMRVGAADVGFVAQFGGSSTVCCVLEPEGTSPDIQRSYFNVSVSSVLGQRTSNA